MEEPSPERDPQAGRPSVGVVTLNFNGGAMTLRCLEALQAIDWPTQKLQITLVDNASSDGVVEQVRTRWPRIRVIESDRNLGFAGGTTLGLAQLDTADYVALVNNDVTVSPDWLRPLVAQLESDPELGAACPKILFDRRYLEVDVRSTTARRGRGDARALGVRITGVEVHGRDVLDDVQWWSGFWGPEPDSIAQWSAAHAILRVAVDADRSVPETLRLRVEGAGPGSLELRVGGAPVTAELTTTPTWHAVTVGSAPVDVINNAGSELTRDGYGADRGYLEPDDGRFDQSSDVFAWCGAAVVLSARYLADVGLLDERLFLYYEDLELSWRGRERGWRYRYVPESVVRHLHSATTGEHSSLARYQNERNRLLVLARHASPATTLRAAGRSVLITASYARRDVLSPLLRGHRPRAKIVRDRVRAFGGFLRLLPAMARERRRARSNGDPASRD